MNIGIITHHLVRNYGAALQTYALKHVLNELGHDSHVIDYRHPIHITALRIFRPSTKGFVRTILKYGVILSRYSRLKRRSDRFAQFGQARFNLSKPYHSYKQLSSEPPPCDAFICGSDQIWSPISTRDPAYFLSFAKDTQATCIAYAPSFGVDVIPEEQEEMLKERIAAIPHLSVREEQGRQIIKDLIDRDVDVVLDPSLLLDGDHWRSVAGSSFDCPEQYILVYDLQNRPILSAIVDFLQERIGPLPVIAIAAGPDIGIKNAAKYVYDAGPSDFLQLVANAKFVVTDSFHGTVFSILFGKPFFTVPHTLTNSRLSSILERLKLHDRIITDVGAIVDDPIVLDFSNAYSILDQERDKSLSFLKSSLGTK